MKRYIFLFLISLAIISVDAQPSFIKDSLDSYIKKGMTDWQIPGLAIAIVKDGKVVVSKGYGYRKIGSNEPVDENTLFMIGSNTKAFTATALATLHEEKKMSLDDNVSKWIPYFKLRDESANALITVRDLLCHRIGFETFQGDFTYWTSTLSREAVIRKMAAVEAPYSFRTKWGYCNAAFTTAGEVIPAVTGKSWEEYVQEKITKPLGMSHTLMLAKELSSASNAATPHTLVDDKLTVLPIAQIDNLAAAGSISSSVNDMSKWLLLQLQKGKFNNNQIIPESAIAQTRVPHSFMGFDQRDKVNSHFYMYGLGFDINDRSGKIVVAHTGGVDGFLSSLVLVPEEQLGIIVLTNTDQNSFFRALTNEIRDAYLQLPYTGFSRRSLAQNKQLQVTEKKVTDSLKNLTTRKDIKTAVPLKNFVGSYTNSLYGSVTISEEKNALFIRFEHHPQLSARLQPISATEFLCTYSIPTYGIKVFPFVVKNNEVKSFTLTVADFVEFTPYEFVKK
jgi:CubicO group peptidase (beta-lactamase class C family)